MWSFKVADLAFRIRVHPEMDGHELKGHCIMAAEWVREGLWNRVRINPCDFIQNRLSRFRNGVHARLCAFSRSLHYGRQIAEGIMG